MLDKPLKLEVGNKYWYKNKEVELIALPDEEYKVAIKRPDGTYQLVNWTDLELIPKERFHAWWAGESSIIIQSATIDGDCTRIKLPREFLPELRRVMFSKKVAVRELLKPLNAEEIEREMDEAAKEVDKE